MSPNHPHFPEQNECHGVDCLVSAIWGRPRIDWNLPATARERFRKAGRTGLVVVGEAGTGAGTGGLGGRGIGLEGELIDGLEQVVIDRVGQGRR